MHVYVLQSKVRLLWQPLMSSHCSCYGTKAALAMAWRERKSDGGRDRNRDEGIMEEVSGKRWFAKQSRLKDEARERERDVDE